MIFSVFKIANLSLYCIANKIFYVIVLLLICFGDQFIKIFIQSLYLKEYTAKRLIDEFSEKGWTKRSVNKLYKKLRDTCTVNRQPCSGRARSTPTEENAKLLLPKSPQSATDFVLPTGRWSDQEHLFENKVSGILRELLKQKLSALHASSTVGLCQLLCTAPLKTFQMQVLKNNLGYRRPMNIRLPWYLVVALLLRPL